MNKSCFVVYGAVELHVPVYDLPQLPQRLGARAGYQVGLEVSLRRTVIIVRDVLQKTLQL